MAESWARQFLDRAQERRGGPHQDRQWAEIRRLFPAYWADVRRALEADLSDFNGDPRARIRLSLRLGGDGITAAIEDQAGSDAVVRCDLLAGCGAPPAYIHATYRNGLSANERDNSPAVTIYLSLVDANLSCTGIERHGKQRVRTGAQLSVVDAARELLEPFLIIVSELP